MPDRSGPHRSGGRVAVLFHESEILGAGVSVVRVLDELGRLGWSAAGWFPGGGPLVETASSGLVGSVVHDKPIAFSVTGWRRGPGPVERLRRTPAYLRAFARWLRTDRPDVVHANSLLMLPEATIARRLGLPVVVQVHELPPEGRKRDVSVRWAAAVAEVLVGVSGPVCRMLERQAGRTPVLAVRNGVPVIHPSRRDDGPFTVGTIGHVARTKGTDVFLQAARLVLDALPDVRFEHVGPARIWADEAFDDEVEQLAATPPLREALQMLGRRPAVDELARWSVFVLPSRQEAFPLSTLEAMAAGLPVVASGVGGIPEQIEHLRTGILVPPEDPAVLSAWIVRLREDDELRGRLGAAAREHVRTAFTLEAQARGLAAAYETARAGRPDRRVLG